ncbi:MAG: LPS-assembly protein LptD [Rhodobacteraceae bacterium]|nr:LPS-assembly protein LptD [Paracoccaceae bacterium]
MLRAWSLVLALILSPLAAQAQVATLVADSVSISSDGDTVVARGNVEIFFDNQRLLAKAITYNRSNDELQITGPITLIETDGSVMTGGDATLSGDFKQGIISGARFILGGQMQIAATELHRVDGRYNQLYKTVASSCNVCQHRPTPLWRIRARRVVHDQVEKQLYFYHARFEVVGVPIFYFPRLRLPDPTLRRATGFLIPQIKTSSNLGIGLKSPYFITLGDHADLRLTPYVSADTRTLEARFRREFSFGSLELSGAISRDDLLPGDTRAYAFAQGRFRLPRDFDLNLDLGLVSDNSYLLTYGYSGTDRLGNSAEITRTRRNEYISFSAEKLRSLRASEIPIEDTLATFLGRATYERRFNPGLVGGEARLVFDLEGHERLADTITPALTAACLVASAPECTARDVVRAGALANWRRDWTLGSGLIAAAEGQLAADFYWINQDAAFADSLTHITPTAAVELRWPLSRMTSRGASDILEPVVQIAWTDTLGANVPNDDSKLVDFDEGNLLSLSRFPGSDRYERGWRSTVGLSWTRLVPGGNQYSATVGRVFRADDLGQFTRASGLDGSSSDWLIATQLKMRHLTLTNRSLFDDTFSFSKSESQLAWHGDKLTASAAFIWVVDDPDEGRTGDTSELNFDATYALDRHWTLSANGSYDGNTNNATNAGLGIGYRNECVNIDLSLSRRFTTSTNVTASTDFGFSVSLNGFGQDGRDHARTCKYSG